jgi:hypothetical protein
MDGELLLELNKSFRIVQRPTGNFTGVILSSHSQNEHADAE